MTITWTPITDAIEASIATEVGTKIAAAADALKVALDAFFAVFTGTPDDDFVEIQTFLEDLAAAIESSELAPTSSDIVAAVTTNMDAWVLAAHETIVTGSTATEISTEVVPRRHEGDLPHVMEEPE